MSWRSREPFAETNEVDGIRLHAGEIVGLAGLLGGGTEERLQSLFGLPTTRDVVGARKRREINSPSAATAFGIGMVPGERRLGLVMSLSVSDNILLPSLDRLHRIGCLDKRQGARLVNELMETLDITPRNPKLRAGALSGGNQQKVIIAKWLVRRVGVLLLNEPTQGVDVAAKAQIHALVEDFVARGGAALVNSSDISELVFLCDAILAVRRGQIIRRFDRAAGIEEVQVQAAIGG
jgi:ABC-type sugar transport system ATPase subunit